MHIKMLLKRLYQANRSQAFLATVGSLQETSCGQTGGATRSLLGCGALLGITKTKTHKESQKVVIHPLLCYAQVQNRTSFLDLLG